MRIASDVPAPVPQADAAVLPATEPAPDAAVGPDRLEDLARYVRYLILAATTRAGSGHPTSALSATDLMTALMFGGAFRYHVDDPRHPNNDRLIFSKGHASPLLYALWCVAGCLTEEELMTYRRFDSRLEGHPTDRFPYAAAATGSLGQGLSIGLGMALNAKYLDRLPYRTWVLLGDSEMTEGSQWEAIELAAHYRTGNLIGILDVNRLGQRGPTLFEHDLDAYERRFSAFGWNTIGVDGHVMPEILKAFETARAGGERPTVIIARTIKGKGVPEIEDRNGWHGKALDPQHFERAVTALGRIDRSVRGRIMAPADVRPVRASTGSENPLHYDASQQVATRDAYGNALKRLLPVCPDLVSLDGEVSNSTRAERFHNEHPDRFFEMYIAEQNMAGVATGLALCGRIPFVSTFSAFLTRAFDQIRMAPYSGAGIKFVGSHSGVSIGEDGPSQMGLEDIAMFRTIPDCIVLHPCDAVSTERLVEVAARSPGIVYLRTMRQKTPVRYSPDSEFRVGGSMTLLRDDADIATIVAAGATVAEALQAAAVLAEEGVRVAVIDAYSIQPIDATALRKAAERTGSIVTVEDHHAAGGLGEAVASALASVPVDLHIMAVRKRPRSGTPEELRDFEEISARHIVRRVRAIAELDPRHTRMTGRHS